MSNYSVLYWPVRKYKESVTDCTNFRVGIGYPLNAIFNKSSAAAEMGVRLALATIDMSRKVGSFCAPFHGGAGSPSNTMWPGTRPSFLPNGILIHSAAWPQQTENWGLCPFWGELGHI